MRPDCAASPCSSCSSTTPRHTSDLTLLVQVRDSLSFSVVAAMLITIRAFRCSTRGGCARLLCSIASHAFEDAVLVGELRELRRQRAASVRQGVWLQVTKTTHESGDEGVLYKLRRGVLGAVAVTQVVGM